MKKNIIFVIIGMIIGFGVASMIFTPQIDKGKEDKEEIIEEEITINKDLIGTWETRKLEEDIDKLETKDTCYGGNNYRKLEIDKKGKVKYTYITVNQNDNCKTLYIATGDISGNKIVLKEEIKDDETKEIRNVTDFVLDDKETMTFYPYPNRDYKYTLMKR